jgi:hypothetical protein
MIFVLNNQKIIFIIINPFHRRHHYYYYYYYLLLLFIISILYYSLGFFSGGCNVSPLFPTAAFPSVSDAIEAPSTPGAPA